MTETGYDYTPPPPPKETSLVWLQCIVNTLQIEHILKRHPRIRPVFTGVYARNRLPRLLSDPMALVGNTDVTSGHVTSGSTSSYPRKYYLELCWYTTDEQYGPNIHWHLENRSRSAIAFYTNYSCCLITCTALKHITYHILPMYLACFVYLAFI